jgi:hypothetical protein
VRAAIGITGLGTDLDGTANFEKIGLLSEEQIHRHLAGSFRGIESTVRHFNERLPLLLMLVLSYLDLVIEYWVILVTTIGLVPLDVKIASFLFYYQIPHQVRSRILLSRWFLTDEPIVDRTDTLSVDPVDPTLDRRASHVVENVTLLLPVLDRSGLINLIRLNPVVAPMVEERLKETLLLSDRISPDSGDLSSPFHACLFSLGVV